MRRTIYVETSIISYLAARPRRDLITAAHQQVTHAWWQERRSEFDLYVSQVVIDEAAAGDPDAAMRRAGLLAELPLLDIAPDAAELAAALSERPTSPAGGCRCGAYCDCRLPRNRLPADLELCAYRERGATPAD